MSQIYQEIASLADRHYTIEEFYLAVQRKLGNNIRYTKTHIENYNKKAILESDKSLFLKRIRYVVEYDVNSFYLSVITINKDNIFPQELVSFCKALIATRQMLKDTQQTDLETKFKQYSNQVIGCLGSHKEKCAKMKDMYSHSIVMEHSRQEITRLVEYSNLNKLKILQIQTDAVFIACDNQDQADLTIKLLKSFESQYTYKIKIHKDFFHFKQPNRYISRVNDEMCLKDFSKKSNDQFAQYADEFLKGNECSLLDAYNNIDDEILKSVLMRLFVDFPSIKEKLKNYVCFRVETIEFTNINRQIYWIHESQIESWFIETMQIHNNHCAIHEIITNDIQFLVFDIDELTDQQLEQEDPIEQVVYDINKFICNHPVINILFSRPPHHTVASYLVNGKPSIHITFDCLLPLQIQQQLAEQLKKINIIADNAIYGINRSLRLPNCPKIVDNQFDFNRVLKLGEDSTLLEYLFTISQKMNHKYQTPYYNYWIKEQYTAIDYSIEFHNEQYQSVLQDKLSEFGVKIKDIVGNSRNHFKIMIEEQDICCVCKRRHDYKLNRQYLKCNIFKHHVTIGCKRQCMRTPTMPDIDLGEIKLDPKYTIDYMPKIIDADIQLNQKYLLPDNDKNIPYKINKNEIHHIISGMGTGKGIVIDKLLVQFKRVLLVSTRKVFTYCNKTRFGHADLQIYLFVARITKSGICQIESLDKAEGTQFDCIVLDEWQSIMQQIVSSSDDNFDYYKAKITANKLIKCLKRCQRIVCMDAQYEETSINWFKNFFPDHKHTVTQNIYQSFKGNNLTIIQRAKGAEACGLIVQEVIERFQNKQKSWVIISSKKHLKIVNDQLKQICPEMQIKPFFGDPLDKEIDKSYNSNNQKTHEANNIEFFSNPDNFKQIDVIVANSTITSGLDVSGYGFTKVFGFIKSGQFSPQQLLQHIHRSRDVKDVILYSPSLRKLRSGIKPLIQHIDLDTPINQIIDNPATTSLVYLSQQYQNDLNNLGIEYVSEWCKYMGYKVNFLDQGGKSFGKDTPTVNLTTDIVKQNKVICQVFKELIEYPNTKQYSEMYEMSRDIAWKCLIGSTTCKGYTLITQDTEKLPQHISQAVKLIGMSIIAQSTEFLELKPSKWSDVMNTYVIQALVHIQEIIKQFGFDEVYKYFTKKCTQLRRNINTMKKISQLNDRKEIFKVLVDCHISDAKNVSTVYNQVKFVIDNDLYKMSISEILEFQQNNKTPINMFELLGIFRSQRCKQKKINGVAVRQYNYLKTNFNEQVIQGFDVEIIVQC